MKNDPEEIEANRFAMELLMPWDWLKHDIRKIGGVDIENDRSTISKLAHQYQVSEQIMTIRVGMILRDERIL